MSLQVQITITGSDRVRQKMKRLGSSLYDFNTAMKEIGQEGSRYFQGPAWLSQGGVFGNKWDRLSTAYAGRKAKRFPGRGPLEASGAMRNLFDFDHSRNSVYIGNLAPYFKYHQSTEARSRLPRRQMIGVSSGFKAIVRDILEKDVREKIRKA